MKTKIVAQDKEHLKQLIKKEMELSGNECDLNHIDVSKIEDMSCLFNMSRFNGNISQWDTSNVIDLSYMFYDSQFNQDISRWDVSKVKDMSGLFLNSQFNRNISPWNTSSVNDMSYLFSLSEFKGDISQWDVSSVMNMQSIFTQSALEKNGQLPYWNLPTQEERIQAILKYSAQKEIKYIDDVLNLSSISESQIKFTLEGLKKVKKL